jgi:hypothetical protein
MPKIKLNLIDPSWEKRMRKLNIIRFVEINTSNNHLIKKKNHDTLVNVKK